jgi:hypothetical protein
MARDRIAFNAAWQRWYRKNAKRKMTWQQRRRDELRQWWNELRATKSCARCGERTPECLEFHHVAPEAKDVEVSRLVANGASRKRILAEIARCEVLCANCHLIHHWNERATDTRTTVASGGEKG